LPKKREIEVAIIRGAALLPVALARGKEVEKGAKEAAISFFRPFVPQERARNLVLNAIVSSSPHPFPSFGDALKGSTANGTRALSSWGAGKWGWKEPNSHVLLDRLAYPFP
jgi:hypothetical protein